MNFNSDLIDDIAKRRVVLFVGSGVSASAVTRSGTRMKQWSEFLRNAAKQMSAGQPSNVVKQCIDHADFLLAAEILKENLSSDQWRDIIHQEFGQIAGTSDLHRAIVKLGQRIVVTTNFDKLLENAWSDPAIDATHYPQVVTALNAEIFRILRDDQNHLIKLHGSVDDPNSMVFAKSDYAKHAFGNWAYSQFVETLLLTHTFLFIGFSMSDPAVSQLIELNAQKYPENRPHYIFLPDPVDPQIVSVAKRLRRLFVMQYSPENGHQQLVDHILELGDHAAKRRKEILAEMRRGLRP